MHDIIYVLIKGIHHQSHHEYKTSANKQGMIKHVNHTVYTSHKDCNFDNKISILSGRAGSTRKRHGALLM